MPLLADGVARVFRAGWALVLDAPGRRLGRRARREQLGSGAARAPGAVVAARAGPPAAGRQTWAPADWDRLGTELAVAPLGEAALLVGRPALHWLPSELVRLRHLAAIAGTVTAASAPVTAGVLRPDRSPS